MLGHSPFSCASAADEASGGSGALDLVHRPRVGTGARAARRGVSISRYLVERGLTASPSRPGEAALHEMNDRLGRILERTLAGTDPDGGQPAESGELPCRRDDARHGPGRARRRAARDSGRAVRRGRGGDPGAVPPAARVTTTTSPGSPAAVLRPAVPPFSFARARPPRKSGRVARGRAGFPRRRSRGSCGSRPAPAALRRATNRSRNARPVGRPPRPTGHGTGSSPEGFRRIFARTGPLPAARLPGAAVRRRGGVRARTEAASVKTAVPNRKIHGSQRLKRAIAQFALRMLHCRQADAVPRKSSPTG